MVIVPCGVTSTNIADIVEHCDKLAQLLRDDGNLRVIVDSRENYSPGWKFNHWELKVLFVALFAIIHVVFILGCASTSRNWTT